MGSEQSKQQREGADTGLVRPIDEEERKKRELPLLGYHLDESLRVVDDSGAPFDPDHSPAWMYDVLGARVADELDRLLTERAQLERIVLHGSKGIEHTTVYATPRLAERDAPLLVVIPGSGKVYNGVMSRSVSLRESLRTGTCWGHVEKALAAGMSVLVLNPNQRPCTKPKARAQRRGAAKQDEPDWARRDRYHMHKFAGLVLSDGWEVDQFAWSPEEHADHVWRTMVAPSRAQSISIIAHSYGGALACRLIADEPSDAVLARVAAVALADSVHPDTVAPQHPRHAFFCEESRIVNWVRSPQPLDTALGQGASGVHTRSGGTQDHAQTYSCAHDCMWNLVTRATTSRKA